MTGAAESGTVTVLFTDLVGSTELSTRLSVPEAEQLRRRYFDLLRDAVEAHGGTEVKNLGDGLMVVFSRPSAALGCAVAIQQAVEVHNREAAHPLAVRIGVSGGEATVEDGDYFGDPVVEAARLCARADGGQILVAELVRAMAGRRAELTFRVVGDLDLKGLPAPLPTLEVAWEPLAPAAAAVPLPARLAVTPTVGFFGRVTEMAGLAVALKAVDAGGGLRVALVAGEPGLGKTTLCGEFARAAHAEGAMVLYGRCEEELAIPYQPFAEALSHYVAHA